MMFRTVLTVRLVPRRVFCARSLARKASSRAFVTSCSGAEPSSGRMIASKHRRFFCEVECRTKGGTFL